MPKVNLPVKEYDFIVRFADRYDMEKSEALAYIIEYYQSDNDISLPISEIKNTQKEILQKLESLQKNTKDEQKEEDSKTNTYSSRHNKKFKDKRDEILERDNYTCRFHNCKVDNEAHKKNDNLFPPNGGLHIHHIIPTRTFDIEDIDESHNNDNLISLCHRHHMHIENNSNINIQEVTTDIP